MRHTIYAVLLGLLLMTGINVSAQAPETPENTTTISTQLTKLKQEAREKKGKRLTRYEETDLEQQLEFLEAVKTGDLQEAREKIKAPYFYAYDDGGETALTRSIKNKDVDMVRFLEADAVINLPNEKGETPLILAIKSGNETILEIIKERANPSLQDAAGLSPLMAALQQHNTKLVQEFIRKGADLNATSQGRTPLFYAVEQLKTDAVALLVHHGADPGIANEAGEIPLYHAVRNGHNVITGILLHKSGSSAKDANWKDRNGEPLLNLAIKADHDQITRMLLDFGADIFQTDYMEDTPLNLAAQQGDLALVEILLARGADPNHRNITGETPLLSAAREGHGRIANMLAEAGADPTTTDFNGFAARDRHNFEGLTDPEIVDAVMEVTDDFNDK